MFKDSIAIEILEDGTISVTTSGISGQNHVSADDLLSEIAKLAGGQVTSRKRTKIELGASLGAALAAHAADGHTHGTGGHSH